MKYMTQMHNNGVTNDLMRRLAQEVTIKPGAFDETTDEGQLHLNVNIFN